MASAPVITFRDPLGNLLSSISYIQNSPAGSVLPIAANNGSVAVLFRTYNNYALASSIASAFNISLTVYDGVGANSKTCTLLPVSQSWVRIQMYGYGENSVDSPDFFTKYLGSETAIGGNGPCGSNIYIPERSSDGVDALNEIRAYSNGNGMGYLEFSTSVSTPTSIPSQTYTFGLSVFYEWHS